jgi:LysM repeat protein
MIFKSITYSFILLFSFLSAGHLNAQINAKAQNYIDLYSEAAVKNMARHGVPASITLAQGMLESGYGESKLAKSANNHFGIKCGNWTGKKVYADDDRPNECFRRYKSAFESFEDHSLFLSSKERYAFLFDLKTTDYKGWAHGLRKAGYATNNRYPDLLIKLIEQYELDQFDSKRQPNNSTQNALAINEIERIHGLSAYSVKPSETLSQIATKLDFPVRRILAYNELGTNDQLEAGQILFLEKKRNRANRSYKTHQVAPGENLFDIAHSYGMNYEALLYLNRMSFGSKVETGKILQLRKRVRKNLR